MTFYGIDDQVVEFKIINYQYPENKNGDWDGNWLSIYLSVKSVFGNWEVTDPSLTTWKVQDLIEWFKKLSEDKEPEYYDMRFTEPNISIELISNYNQHQKKFRIKFNAELRPKTASNNVNYFVDCIANNEQLESLANDLTTELNNYPERI